MTLNLITKDLFNTSGIYKITNENNGKVYIGQSIELEKRYRSHRNQLRNGKHHNLRLQRSYNRGDSLKFEVLVMCPEVSLNELEIKFISLFDSTNGEFGYNLDSGGGAGKKMSEESLEKLSKSQKLYFSKK